MIIFAIIVAVLAGMAFGAVTLWLWLPRRFKHHIDYRKRWENAVTLLGAQGQLTDEQVALLRGNQSPPSKPLITVRSAPTDVLGMLTDPARNTLRMLHTMSSWDRKTVEVTRAENGLPPVDDLLGMTSFDKRVVMTARVQAGLAQELRESRQERGMEERRS